MPVNERGDKVAPLNALRGPRRGRLPVIVHQIRENAFSLPDDSLLDKTFDATIPEQRAERDAIWGLITKDARAGYFAIAIGQIWEDVKGIREQMIQQGSDIGLARATRIQTNPNNSQHNIIEGLTPVNADDITDPLHELSKDIHEVFQYATQLWETREQAKQPQEEGYIFLQKMMAFAERNGSRKIKTPGERIENGLISATTTMPELLRTIPQVFERKFRRKITEQEYEQIARSSFGIITHLAAINADYTPLVENRLQTEDGEWDPYKFVLAVKGDHMHVQFNEGFLQSIENDFRNAPFTSITEGCSAMTSIDSLGNNVNVIREMWNLYVDLAKATYFPSFRSN